MTYPVWGVMPMFPTKYPSRPDSQNMNRTKRVNPLTAVGFSRGCRNRLDPLALESDRRPRSDLQLPDPPRGAYEHGSP